MSFLPLVLLLAIHFIPPLSPQQRERLAGAADGVDHHEDAFTALIENATAPAGGNRAKGIGSDSDAATGAEDANLFTQKGNYGDAPPRHANVDSLLADSPAHRGELWLVEGVLQQHALLQSPHELVMECFVRDADDTPLLLFLAGPPRGTLRDGQRIRTPARYYKRIDLIARDGQLRSYPAFVAGATWMEMPAGSHRRDVRIERLWYIAAPVILMTIIFAAMNIRTRRKRHARGDRLAASQDHSHDQPGVEVNADLPDDPAAAMAELRRRAQGHHAQD